MNRADAFRWIYVSRGVSVLAASVVWRAQFVKNRKA